MRITDAQTMDVVEMVLAGQVNKEIVAGVGRAGRSGFDGARRRALRATKLEVEPTNTAPERSISSVSAPSMRLTQRLSARSSAPRLSLWWRRSVMGKVGCAQHQRRPRGATLGLAASGAAAADDRCGRRQRPKRRLIRQLDVADVDALIEDGTISGGMIPKVRGAVEAHRASPR